VSGDSAPAAVEAAYFDGHSARAHPVRVRAQAGCLHIDGPGVQRSLPLQTLRWPERTRHGVRLMQLPDGAVLQCGDSIAWDAWSRTHAGRRDSPVVRLQQHWRGVAASLLVTVALVGAGYRWGLPWAAQRLVAVIPPAVDRTIGSAALASADEQRWLQPSQLPADVQQRIRDSFADAVSRLPAPTVPAYRLEFRGSTIGPNAFALPGGAIVVTDDLVRCVHGDREMLVGVLGHELGHLRRRHGMRMVVQAGAVGAAAAGAFYGDFSSLLALVPTWLGQASYSRDAEREADADSVRLLRANGISPAVMARFFRLLHPKGDGPTGAAYLRMGIASHPGDAERIRFFEQAAAQR
jgi:Zn-dependent protease with chaperone function